jgi:hypothetical protein
MWKEQKQKRVTCKKSPLIARIFQASNIIKEIIVIKNREVDNKNGCFIEKLRNPK